MPTAVQLISAQKKRSINYESFHKKIRPSRRKRKRFANNIYFEIRSNPIKLPIDHSKKPKANDPHSHISNSFKQYENRAPIRGHIISALRSIESAINLALYDLVWRRIDTRTGVAKRGDSTTCSLRHHHKNI